MYVLMSMSIGY